jgi:hypothetical protein
MNHLPVEKPLEHGRCDFVFENFGEPRCSDGFGKRVAAVCASDRSILAVAAPSKLIARVD